MSMQVAPEIAKLMPEPVFSNLCGTAKGSIADNRVHLSCDLELSNRMKSRRCSSRGGFFLALRPVG